MFHGSSPAGSPTPTDRPLGLIVGVDVRVRRSLAGLVESSGLLRVIGSTSGVIETLDLVRACHPDVILLDFDRPDAGAWLDLVSNLKAACPRCAIAVLSVATTLRGRVLAGGVDAFISKTEPPAAIQDAIAALCPGAAAVPVERTAHPSAHPLTSREE